MSKERLSLHGLTTLHEKGAQDPVGNFGNVNCMRIGAQRACCYNVHTPYGGGWFEEAVLLGVIPLIYLRRRPDASAALVKRVFEMTVFVPSHTLCPGFLVMCRLHACTVRFPFLFPFFISILCDG